MISKKTFSFVVLLLLVSGQNLFSQRDTILIFHPTVYNINMVLNIFENVLDEKQTQQYYFKGVYHRDEIYNYQESKNFLAIPENKGLAFGLTEISGNPAPADLSRNNEFTAQFNSIFNTSIGAIFLGGPDIPPAIYQEKTHLLTSVTDPWRHYMEISALSHLLGSSRNLANVPYLESDPNFVVLGICLGMQSMNVACGGTLIQDIPDELYGMETVEDVLSSPERMHRNYAFDDPSDTIYLTGYHLHPVHATGPNPLSKKLGIKQGEELFVLSSHHQAIETLGKGLVPVLWSADEKIIEAVQHDTYSSVLGVQFHPEKPDIFYPGTTQWVSADSIVNFNSFLKEHHSYRGHLKFWEYIAALFRKNNS